MIEIQKTPYSYEDSLDQQLRSLSSRVCEMRSAGKLSPQVLHRIRRFFRIKSIFHSNAIEGNLLEVGETRQVVELGLTITGRPLKDQAEARNLSQALDFLEELAGSPDRQIIENDIRSIHSLVLGGINEDAGRYRTVSVEISGSGYPPTNPESIPAHMQDLSNWLSEVSAPQERDFCSVDGLLVAAVAHTWFVMIHPFIDGNGRVARLLMNLLLMRFGYPIAIISKEDRLRYYDALEISQASDLTPFIVLLTECIEESLGEWERAAEEQQEAIEWARSLAQRMGEAEETKFRNEYEVWRNAMELLKSYLRQSTDTLNEQFPFGSVYFRDFGTLEFEKYASLRIGDSAKRTWFFRVDFRSETKSARYLFFFGRRNHVLRDRCDVTLHVAREEPENSFNFKRLEHIDAANVPDLVEIGYEMTKEQFVSRKRNGRTRRGLVEEIGQRFFEDVTNKHFKL